MYKYLNIKFKRIEQKLSQKQLADLIGVTSQSISDYERGKTVPSYENMQKLSKVLNAPVGELFFDEG